jgi:hypothetical protein
MDPVTVPDEEQTVFIRVGTTLPVADRAIVEGEVKQVSETEDGFSFTVNHHRVHQIGVFDDKYGSSETAKDVLGSGSSGPYGPQFDEAYGEVWAYELEDL